MDSKSKKQLIVIAVLAPVLVIALVANRPRSRSGNSSAPQPVAAAVASGAQPVAAKAVEMPPPAELEARRAALAKIKEQPWGRNPFVTKVIAAPPAAASAPVARERAPAAASQPVFNLEGIVYDTKSPYAVIDGELRVVGDRIQDYIITKITTDTVTLEKDGEPLDLRMFPEVR